MHSVTTDRFPMVHVPPAARACKKFVEVKLPLISVGNLCTHGLIVQFDAQNVYVFTQQGRLVSKGRRDTLRNLYQIPIGDTHEPPRVDLPVSKATVRLTDNYAHNAHEVRAVPALVSYLHACAGYIPKETFIKRINAGFYLGWPGLTAARVRKHLPKSEATTLGHQILVR